MPSEDHTRAAIDGGLADAIFESLEEGLVVLGPSGEVLTANAHAAELLGLSTAELAAADLQRPPIRAFREDGTELRAETSLALAAMREGNELRDVPLRIERPDGSELWVSANYLPLRGSGGAAPGGVVCSFTDITASRRAEHDLAETESRFRDLAENVQAVFWVRNARTDEILYVSPAYEEIWGHPVDELYSDWRAWLDAIHPDDRPGVFEAALEGGQSGEYYAEYRIIRPDGDVRWIRDRAFTRRATAERTEVVTGMAEDVTERRATALALAEARERARAAFMNAPTGSAIVDLGSSPHHILEVNPALCALLGYPEAEMVGAETGGFIDLSLAAADGHWERLVAGELETYSVERQLVRKDGGLIWCRMQLSMIRSGDGEPAYAVAQLEDITAARRAGSRQAAVAALSREALEGAGVEKLMSAAVEAVDDALGAVITGILEYLPDRDELQPRAVGEVPEAVVPDTRRTAVMSPHLRAALDGRRPVVVEDWETDDRFERSGVLERLQARSTVAVPIQGPSGAWGVMVAHSSEQRSFAPDEISFMQAVANVLGAGIQRRLAEEDAQFRALHDPLTELPNRTLLLDRLGHALDRAKRVDGRVAVLFMDLDHFKVINDSLGHEAGDGLLFAFAPRLKEALRPSDTVARFGGDEFVVLCEDLQSEQDAVHLAERILESLQSPFTIGSHELFTSATIGLALAEPGATPEGLIRDADAAMYRAKARGRGRYELFDQAMRERVSERLRTENALRRALADGALELHYQPIVALDDRSIVGAEALLRWHDPDRGWIPPNHFIPIAEESGLIVPIGDWVLAEASRQALTWPNPRNGAPAPQLAVNLSARQVAHPGFSDLLVESLERSGLPPERLSLEITESLLMEESDAPAETVRRLKGLGVKLVLDDFGTGYSSLSYLSRLPIDVLKLDRSFIAPLREDGHTSAAIVSGVVTMAEALGMTVVAEGVEEDVQVQQLRALGCDFAQGFLFARPLPPAGIAELLRAGALPRPGGDPVGSRQAS